jgi:lactoylglutathione lyase
VRTLAAAALVAVAMQSAPSRPAVLGLAHVRLYTSSLAKARAFYGTVLGYPETANPGTASSVFRVNDRQRIIVREGLPANQDDRFIDVAFETSDENAAAAYLASRGLPADPLDDVPDGGGRAVATRDPDGHRIELLVRFSGPAPRDPNDRRISTRILHAGLTIRDAARADAFYKDVLGFSEIWRGGRAEGALSWINMRVPDGTDYLEYMLTASPPDRRQLGVAHHIALLVPSIQDALEAVRARTSADDPNHRAVPQIGRNNRWQLNLFDPDGTRIEFMEPWTVR